SGLEKSILNGLMIRLIVNWVFSAAALVIVAHLVGGFRVSSLAAALIAAIVIGFANATIGFVLRVLTFPLTLVTFGVFWFVINAIMLKLASVFVPGFQIDGFIPAFIGAIVLSIVNLIFRKVSNAMFRED